MPRNLSKKECTICKKIFLQKRSDSLSYFKTKRFCSQKCSAVWKREMGMLSYWKGKKRSRELIAKQTAHLKGNKYAKGHIHTEEARKKMSLSKSNEKHWSWKGDKASYSAVHKWLVKNYGPASKCENKTCLKKSQKFQYALKHNCNYIHNRNSFGMLCISCHKYYDSRINKINVQL